MDTTVRTHFVLPASLLEEFDRLVGARRKRSETVAALMEEWVRREKAKDVFTRLAGFVKAENHPEWATDQDVYSWVRQLRGEYTVPDIEQEDRDG